MDILRNDKKSKQIKADILEDNRINTARRLTVSSILISLVYHFLFTLYISPPNYIITLNIFLALSYFLPMKMISTKNNNLGKFLSFTIGNIQLLSAAFFFGNMTGFHYLMLDKLVAINFIFGNSEKTPKKLLIIANIYTMVLFLVASVFFTPENAFVKLTLEEQNTFKIVSIIFCSFLIFITTFIFFKDATKLENKLADEHEKNKILLNSLLPKQIINSWQKDHNTRESFYHKDASIMFIKIANFDELTKHMKVLEKLQILNYIYSLFDKIIEKYQLEKIKTIGDTYMVASGVPAYNDEHLAHTIKCAKKIIDEFDVIIKDLNISFSIEIGIHSGELASGVVGSKKIVYDVWGETVNIASRLCNLANNRQIIISQSIYDKCSCEYNIIQNGKFEVKGIGNMMTYSIEGFSK